MKDVYYSKFYGERFCLKCEKLLQEDEFVIIETVSSGGEAQIKEKKFRCKWPCSELTIKFDNPFLWFIKAYGLSVLIFGLGIIILVKDFSDLSEYWLLIPVSLVFFFGALGYFLTERDDKKKIKLLVQKIAAQKNVPLE